MDLFRYLIRTSRRTFSFAVGAGMVSGLAGAGFIAMVNRALNAGGNPSAGIVVGFVAVCLGALGMRFVSQVLLYRLSQGAVYELRLRLARSILSAPLRSVEEMGTARLYSALSDDVTVIASALPGLPLICSSVAFALGCFAYLATLSPVVALIAFLFAIIGVAVYRLFASYGSRFLQSAREEQDRLFDHFRAVTEGIKELKLNRQRREDLVDRQLDGTAAAFRDRSVVGLSIFEGATGGGQAVFFVLVGILLFALRGWVDLPADILASAVLTVLFAVTNVQSILVWLPMLGRASVALRKVRQRQELLRDAAETGTAEQPRFAGWNRVELRGVSHVYTGPMGEEFVLGPVDLEVRRGEVVFIAGANGSGKTTLAKVLTGLYRPETGTIRVDGTPVGDGNREAYRQLFSAIFSDFFLFDTLPGAPDPDRMVLARDYLRRLELDHKVTITDGRFSTTALSQGQRKRLALLAAYLEDRPFYVFDEWAADQDPVFKELFYTRLLAELRAADKAVLVISHDDRYYPVADRLIRLDYGRLREHGPAPARPTSPEEDPGESLAALPPAKFAR